jgi:hypothetical protein
MLCKGMMSFINTDSSVLSVAAGHVNQQYLIDRTQKEGQVFSRKRHR